MESERCYLNFKDFCLQSALEGQARKKEGAAYVVQQTSLMCFDISTGVEVFMRCSLHVVISIGPTIRTPTFYLLTKRRNFPLVR